MIELLTAKELKKIKKEAKESGISAERLTQNLFLAFAEKKDWTLDEYIAFRIKTKENEKLRVQKEKEALSTFWTGYFDGATLPTNPGEKGIGAVLTSPDGAKHTISEKTGYGSNNEAEYQACVALLKLALSLGVKNIVVNGDSQLIVNQVAGDWIVRSQNLIPLNTEAKILASEFEKIVFQWIPREKNKEADKLSKAAFGDQALSKKESKGIWGTQTEIGKKLGLSAVKTGRLMSKHGLREEKNPSEFSLDNGMARKVFLTPMIIQYDWHIENVFNFLKDVVDENELVDNPV